MKPRSAIALLARHEALNFLLTNRLPRRLVSRLVGWCSRIENPLICGASLAVWRLFADLDLSEAETTRFASLRDCFTRRLKPGARPIDPDPDVLVSPCDAIVVACGRVDVATLVQAKGLTYPLGELLCDDTQAAMFEGGTYTTLRLTSSMYHRFHAPDDLHVGAVRHVWGDRWNVNPPALRRVERLYCRNERAVIAGRLSTGQAIALVPIAAILVGGIRLGFMNLPSADRGEVRALPADVTLARGAEIGWFEHGSTIVMLVSAGCRLADGVGPGVAVRMGRALMRRAVLAGE